MKEKIKKTIMAVLLVFCCCMLLGIPVMAENLSDDFSVETDTDADYAEDETLSEKEITELYRGFARSLQSIIANKNMNDLAELLVYPSYIGIDDGIVVNNRTEFMALDAEKVFTDALIEAVKTADVSSTELTKAGFIVGNPSGKPAVTFGLDKEGSIGITGINY